ncbi:MULTISPECIES: cation:dicarboxylase symporter family transporter [unclassified Dysgonomonas]|jgi:Na+/H+-dicarboxylate symporter|uniref:cation:dicarboxylate symporter family transporter n=1 Tax=unclassified Dysgonomonas TaxID=2630389 RepID=UPI0025C3835D|nr:MULTISPECIES: cation:dicarboxylase symporter family transporter [unclassified Dysgonomonas]MDR2005049.1 dicarboxylate/amino acid:cation symporter [Prevotella sp.]HMM02258.1 cation:dicarboxylase symporter family transporter [Dysgonomonas sp.]
MRKLLSNTTLRLLLGVLGGVVLGLFASESLIAVVLPIKHILGQVIFFLIPLIIFGFITPSITRLKKNASRLLGSSLLLAYVSCIGSASLAAFVGYKIIPLLDIVPVKEATNSLPEMLFRLDIPPLMPILSALVFAFLLGLSVIWTKAVKIEGALYEFQDLIFAMVKKILIPILPFFIAANFSILAYEGALASRLPVFLAILVITVLCHLIWISFLYISSGLYARVNPWKVLKYYGPVALTALGTQSSAASLGVAIEQTKKCPELKPEIRDFAIPLFGNIHFPGSILDVVFLSLAVSQLLYGTMPDITQILIFIPLLGIFAIAAPGLPGGTLITSLGLIHAVLGIDDAGAALMITIFALLDSFGTTHNITSDGALTLALSTYTDKKNLSPDLPE